MKPIYKPKGAAKEYGDYAINIYTGCPHRCFYCYAPTILRKDRETFHTDVRPREGIVEAVKQQLVCEKITGQTVHLCFTCDPYPTGCDSTPTREVIEVLKNSGNHVQILTKANGIRDFDLLDETDWYGITDDGQMGVMSDAVSKPYRYAGLAAARYYRIKTWISFEPVILGDGVLDSINRFGKYVDKIKIGKLNYHPSDIDWKEFGQEAERLCQSLGVDYYIKDSLRAEMEKV